MNQYRTELKQNTKALLVWAICQGGLLIMGYIEFLFVFRGDSAISSIMAELPPAFSALFGIGASTDFSTAKGFYCILVDFVFYVLAAYSSLLGVSIISREEAQKTSEFLYSKPVTRSRVFCVKLAVGATCCAALCLITFIVSALTFGTARGEGLMGAVAAAAVSTLLMQLVYFSAGAMFAAVTTPERANTFNLLFLLGTILSGKIFAISGIGGAALILSTGDYFPISKYLYGGGFGAMPWVLGILWAALFLTAALHGIKKKDF